MPVLLSSGRFGAPPPSYAVQVAANAPLAWYRIGESSGATMADSSGNARDGVYGGTNFSRPLTGLITGDANTCARANSTASSGHFISASDAALLPKDFVHECWMVSPGSNVILRDNTSSGGYILDDGALDGTFVAVRVSGTTYVTTYPQATLRDGNKHHVVWRVQGTTSDLWIDGVKVWTQTITAAASRSAPTTKWLMARNGTASTFIALTLDEWAIYSSLSDADIVAHYAAGV